MNAPKYHEGQKIRVTNEYGETLNWTIFAITPTSTGERLTLSGPPRWEDGPEQRATVYTDDAEIRIETEDTARLKTT
jgi:hypothetical protein